MPQNQSSEKRVLKGLLSAAVLKRSHPEAGRTDPYAIIGLILGILSLLSAFLVPEIRRAVGLDGNETGLAQPSLTTRQGMPMPPPVPPPPGFPGQAPNQMPNQMPNQSATPVSTTGANPGFNPMPNFPPPPGSPGQAPNRAGRVPPGSP